MVLLTMTPTIVEAMGKSRSFIQSIQKTSAPPSIATDAPEQQEAVKDSLSNLPAQKSGGKTSIQGHAKDEVEVDAEGVNKSTAEPSLADPKVGNAISHGQVIDLWRHLKAEGTSLYNLDTLLRGAYIFIPPPSPKPEPTSEYKALMARLRRDEEERSYNRMTNPPPPAESFSQRFPASSAAHAFDSNHYPSAPADPFAETDEVTYADVDRQMAMILNVLLSIVACAGAIWVAARWWSTPARLALSMSGSILVGIAEVVVYSGYLRRVAESKGKEKSVKEVKEVMKSWVVGAEEDNVKDASSISSASKVNETPVRRRKKELS